MSDFDCGHPSIGHNDGQCCAVCALGAELQQVRAELATVLEMQKFSTPWDPTGVRNGLRFKAIELELATVMNQLFDAEAERDNAERQLQESR